MALYSSSLLKGVSIATLGGWINGVWNLREFGVINPVVSVCNAESDNLCLLLAAAATTVGRTDTVRWLPSSNDSFTVSSCYKILSNSFVPFGLSNRYDSVFASIWKMEVPIKVKALGWRCFLNKIPTRDNLLVRGILNSSFNLSCVFCEVGESSIHSFLCCRKVFEVWKEMTDWIDMPFHPIIGFKASFWHCSSPCFRLNIKRGKVGCVWLAIVWSLWLRRTISF